MAASTNNAMDSLTAQLDFKCASLEVALCLLFTHDYIETMKSIQALWLDTSCGFLICYWTKTEIMNVWCSTKKITLSVLPFFEWCCQLHIMKMATWRPYDAMLDGYPSTLTYHENQDGVQNSTMIISVEWRSKEHLFICTYITNGWRCTNKLIRPLIILKWSSHFSQSSW